MSTEIIDIQRRFQRRGFSVYRRQSAVHRLVQLQSSSEVVTFDRDIQAQF